MTQNLKLAPNANTFDALTESEARYLTRTEAIETIRNRIADSQ